MPDVLELFEELVSWSNVAKHVLAISTFSYLTCWFLRDVTETVHDMMLDPPAWLHHLWRRLDYVVMGPKGTYTPMLSTWHRALVASIILMFFEHQFCPIGLRQPFSDLGIDIDDNDGQDPEDI